MKVPFSWLCEYVDLDGLSVHEVADKLTMGAFEVEEIKLFGADIQGPLVVGKIVDISAHPNASKIRLTKVKISENAEPLEIVCGAANIQIGDIVPVSLPGAKVINRHDGTPLPIAVTTIRGIQSNGMLCSPPELGISATEIDGILILDKDLERSLGSDIKTILSLGQEHVIHVSPRSNRGDALSIRGLAREVAALTKRQLKQPAWSLNDQCDNSVGKYNLEIENKADCELITIRTIANLTVGKSPAFISRRLESVGIRSVNNIVDITNYVMHELGQSLHAYDADKVVGQSIHVRRAHTGEKTKTLDGKERNLTDEVLVIADEKNVIGLAGIMGGLDSEVSSNTTRIALEAASFQPARVRRGTRILGLSSEASLRFERGIDINSVVTASNMATYLIAKHCGGGGSVAIGAMSKAGSPEREPITVPLRLSQIKRLLEVEPSAKEIIEMLKPLGIEHNSKLDPGNNDMLNFLVPSFRQRDVTREIDLIEEVCRIYGYNHIPESMPKATAAPEPNQDISAKVREALTGQGLNEAYITSLVPADLKTSEGESSGFAKNNQDPKTLVRVLNPLSKEHQVLRQSLLPGLLSAAQYNCDHGEKNVWLFEIGRTYHKKTMSLSPQTKEPVIDEPVRVAGLITGNPTRSHWAEQSHPNHEIKNGDGESTSSYSKSNSAVSPIDFYLAKGIIENLFNRLRIERGQIQFVASKATPPIMHPSRSAHLCVTSPADTNRSDSAALSQPVQSGSSLGWFGEIHPGCADKLGLDPSTYLFELDMQALSSLYQAPQFTRINASPTVSRDLTTDLSNKIEHEKVVACIKAAAGTHLVTIDLISVYALNSNDQSLSYRLTFQHPEHTLRSEDVDKHLTDIRAKLTQQLGASFRA